jgi:hypothetical protein
MKKRKTGAKPVTVSLPELQGGWPYVSVDKQVVFIAFENPDKAHQAMKSWCGHFRRARNKCKLRN